VSLPSNALHWFVKEMKKVTRLTERLKPLTWTVVLFSRHSNHTLNSLWDWKIQITNRGKIFFVGFTCTLNDRVKDKWNEDTENWEAQQDCHC